MANKQAMMELLSDVKIISHSLNLFLLRSGGGGGSFFLGRATSILRDYKLSHNFSDGIIFLSKCNKIKP